jgi:hypothetical protein
MGTCSEAETAEEVRFPAWRVSWPGLQPKCRVCVRRRSGPPLTVCWRRWPGSRRYSKQQVALSGARPSCVTLHVACGCAAAVHSATLHHLAPSAAFAPVTGVSAARSTLLAWEASHGAAAALHLASLRAPDAPARGSLQRLLEALTTEPQQRSVQPLQRGVPGAYDVPLRWHSSIEALLTRQAWQNPWPEGTPLFRVAAAKRQRALCSRDRKLAVDQSLEAAVAHGAAVRDARRCAAARLPPSPQEIWDDAVGQALHAQAVEQHARLAELQSEVVQRRATYDAEAARIAGTRARISFAASAIVAIHQ